MLQAKDSVLLLIDVQGKLAELMHEKAELYHQLQILLRGTRALDVPILWFEQYPKGLGPTVPDVAQVLAGLEPIEKICFSACGSDHVRQALAESGRRTAILAGIEAHVCVYQTACDLLDTGFSVEVVKDAVSSRTVANRQAGLERMAGIGAGMTTVEMLLFEWLGSADAPDFKEISRLVR